MEATDVLGELRVEGSVRGGRVGGKSALWEWKKKKGEAKEAPEHNSDISSKSTGKGLPVRAALEFLPFETKGSEATRTNVGGVSSSPAFFTRGKIN